MINSGKKNRFSDLIIMLSGGINQRRLYFDKHPKVAALGRDFTARLNEMLNRTGETGFFFGVLNGKFIRGGKYLVGPSITGKNLIELSERLGCGGFRFHKDVEPREVVEFFRIGAELREKVATLEDAVALFTSAGIKHIELTPYFRETDSEDERANVDLSQFDPGLIQFDFSDDDEEAGFGRSVALDLAPLLPIFQSMYEAVSSNHVIVTQDQQLDLAPTQTASEELRSAVDQQTMDIMNLMRYPDYDSYTVGHSVRVSTLALTVGKEMGWPEHMWTELTTAGLLHDLGKGKVPEEILYKPGKLTAEERKVAESHAAIGANILLAQGDATPLCVAAAWGHHIRSDGGGYPKVPAWAVKSPIAGLIQVCDVFEALTAARPYKNPLPPRRAFEIILKDRHSFDQLALSALIRAIGLYPPGSEVVLTDGRRGFVVGRGPDWEQPEVRVIRDPKGHRLDPDDQYVLHLHEEEKLEISDFLSVAIKPGEPLGGADATDLDEGDGEVPTTEELLDSVDSIMSDGLD